MAKRIDLRPLRLLEDEPVPGHWVDELKLDSFARVIAGAAVGTDGPFNIGVFADWGQGKTSVLRQAQSLIESDPKYADVVTVWFNAWQYEKEEHPIIPLVASVVHRVELKQAERANKAEASIREGWSSLTRALRAIAYGFSSSAKVKVPGFAEIEAGFVAKEMIERYDKLQTKDDPLLQRSLYYNAFDTLEKLAKEEAGEPEKPWPKIVVFVDDLDRCMPDQGVRLLESIKLVLSQRGFVFVLAVDRRILESYLDKRYRDEFGVTDYRASGTSYLDKIVQLPLPLPSHRSRFETYIKDLLKRPALSEDMDVAEAFSGLTEALAIGANYNPRTLVRFINNLLVDRRVRQLQGESADVEFLRMCAVARILQQHLEPRAYRELLADNELCEAIAGKSDPDLSARFAPPKEETRGSVLGERRQRLQTEFRRLDFLAKLFDDPATGHRWLLEHETRRAVDEFLVVERQASATSPETQAAIVDAAIRSALDKPKDASITEDERQRVTGLNLALSDITDAGLVHLKGLTALQHLSLDGTRVTDAGLVHLKGLTALQYLSLDGTRVTDAGLVHLKGLTALQELSLEGTRVTDAGLVHLKGLTALQELSLDGTPVADAGLVHLKGLTALQRLWLEGTPVTDAGLVHLKGLTALQVLWIDDTRVTDAGLVHLKGLTALQELSLDNTPVTDAGLVHLKGLTALQYLSLDGTPVTDAGAADLRRALPECRVVHQRKSSRN